MSAVPSMRSWPDATLAPAGTVMSSDGVEVAYYELGGEGPPLVLAHATGFCGPVLAPLAGELAGRFRCFALDLRGHGRSSRPRSGNWQWPGFADDVLAVVALLGLERPVAFGHSCGGAAILLAEEHLPGTFAGLYCYEPIVYPGDPPIGPSVEGNTMAAGALRRRVGFASRHDALANFSSKLPFSAMVPGALAAYVDNGFETAPDGSLMLRCRREDEAAIYTLGFAHDAFGRLPAVGCPTAVVLGSQSQTFGPLEGGFLNALGDRLPQGMTATLPGLGHFGPLDDPVTVARSVVDLISVD